MARSCSNNSSETMDESEALLDMQDDDQTKLLEYLHCHQCSYLATDAVDTLCCLVLLCQACFDHLDKVCPNCKHRCSISPNHLARRLIGSQPWRCAHCTTSGSRSDEPEHRRLCPARPRQCPAPGCQFAGLPDQFLNHLVEQHPAQLLRNSALLFSRATLTATTGQSPERQLTFRRNFVLSTGGMFRDPSRTSVQNSGKSYCVQPLNGPPCDCCDGMCGPNNGCNCVDCMRIDLTRYGIRQGERALVNREGVISRVSPESGRFYCGRPNMAHDLETDGFCGPTSGNNCHACRQLDRQAQGRYADIVRQWT